MSFSTNLQAVADKLLTTYGEDVLVVRQNITVYNPSTGTVSASTTTEYAGKGHPSMYDIRYVDDVTIRASDIKLIFYNDNNIVPLAGDVFMLNSTEYTAVDVQQTRAQGTNIVYTVQLRQ